MTDGKDNDGDGKSDCQDPDCQKDRRVAQRCKRMANKHKGGKGGSTKKERGRACFDGKDNDGDGKKDCEDPDCQHNKRTGKICKRRASMGNQIIGNGGKDTTNQIPAGCINWFDGCNSCHRQNVNAPLQCTKRMCFRKGKAECRKHADAGNGGNGGDPNDGGYGGGGN
jgi:hypothetical protein